MHIVHTRACMRTVRACAGRDWSFRRREPLLLSVDGCHAESADERAMLKQDDPWASTPVQARSAVPAVVVVAATVVVVVRA
eukprot:2880364-Pleurochrysis_carterae.AAC.1